MLPALHSDPGVTAFVHFSMGIALRGPPQNGELILARAGGEWQSIRFVSAEPPRAPRLQPEEKSNYFRVVVLAL